MRRKIDFVAVKINGCTPLAGHVVALCSQSEVVDLGG